MTLSPQDTRFLRSLKIEWPADPADDALRVTERTAQRAAHTAALGQHSNCVNQWLAERDEKDRAVLMACDMRKAAENWCMRSKEQAMWARVWCALAVTLAVAVIVLWVKR